jgi:hypothetical protein
VIAVRDEDVVLTRHTADGRFLLFTSTDVRTEWFLPWWGVVVDTGADGYGMLVRLDEHAAPAGWTAQQLLLVARRRLAAECERLPSPEVRDAVAALDRAASVMTERISAPSDGNWGVAFRQGGTPSPYPWCVAGHSGFDIPLCPDPESRDEGVSPEQLLVALDQLLHDAARALPYRADVWQARGHVTAALAAEVRRLSAIRA